MTNDLVPHRMPWEVVPATETLEQTVASLKRDMAYMVKGTAIIVHSNHPALQMLVNTDRGQIIPRNECRFTDGTTLEFADVGMLQPNAPYMTVPELIAQVWDIVQKLGLELVK